MIKTLELFFEHTKYSLTLMISVLTAVLAIAAFSLEKRPSNETLRAIAYVSAGMLFLLVPIGYVSYKLVERYYKLYVTCYVYAARLHKKHAVAKHPWFLDLEKRVVERL